MTPSSGWGDASLLRTLPCPVPTVFPSQPFPRTAPTVTHFLPQTAWTLPLGIFRGLAWTSSQHRVVQFKLPAGSADLQTTGFFNFFENKKKKEKERKSFSKALSFFPINHGAGPGYSPGPMGQRIW